MAQIMTTKEVAGYLKLHEITVCKYATQGQIPAIRIGRVWRFDKDVIDEWMAKIQNDIKAGVKSKTKTSGKAKKK